MPALQDLRPSRAVVLLGKSAFAASPVADMRRIAGLVQDRHRDDAITFAFSEQGGPSLRETLLALRGGSVADVLILPLLVPLEPGLRNWLTTAIGRWQAESPCGWPAIRLGPALGESAHLGMLVDGLIAGAERAPAIVATPRARHAGSLIPPQKRRVLVCQGADCQALGATALWNHLRNVQQRRALRTAGDGTMTAMSSCLGPCNLAPVLQVFPEGTYYCGVTEAGIDRIADEHLLDGRVVQSLAYHPTGKKQTLRT